MNVRVFPDGFKIETEERTRDDRIVELRAECDCGSTFDWNESMSETQEFLMEHIFHGSDVRR